MSSDQVEGFVKNLGLKGRTLEVGSMDVNGTVKPFFKDYTGLDMRKGKNVDILGKANQLPFKSNSFRNVLCLETLEHDEHFWMSIPEMIRVLRPGGRFVLTVPTYYHGQHNFPSDYWRFSKAAVKSILKDLNNLKIEETFNGLFMAAKHKRTETGIDAKVITGITLSSEQFNWAMEEGYAVVPLLGIFAHGNKSKAKN